MIYYGKLFERMKQQGKKSTHIRENKIIGQETLRKLRIGTGIIEQYDYKNPSTKQIEKKTYPLIPNLLNLFVYGFNVNLMILWKLYLTHGIMPND